MNVRSKLPGIFGAVLFLLTIGFGIWIALQGKPYGMVLFTAHKLTAIGATVLAALFCINILKNASAGGKVTALMIIAGISVIALLATGALMSINNDPVASYLRIIHSVSSISLAISGGGAIFFLRNILMKK